MQSDIVQEARLDAKAFRENAVYTSDGQRVKLGANADRLDAYASHMDAQAAEITRLTEALRAAEEREKGLREALVQHNDRLRSAAAVAARDGRETNWLSFRGQVLYTLAEYHELVREAHAALKGPSHD